MELKVWRIFVACDVSGMESAKKEEEANNSFVACNMFFNVLLQLFYRV